MIVNRFVGNNLNLNSEQTSYEFIEVEIGDMLAFTEDGQTEFYILDSFSTGEDGQVVAYCSYRGNGPRVDRLLLY